MTSAPVRPARPPETDPLASLLERADAVSARARERGALQPIRTEQTWLEDAGLRFSVRWVSSLALKDRARVDTVIRRRPDFNPFLPPEPSLTVGELGPRHLVVLNKFPVIERHLLIVTRHFEDQCAPLRRSDFEALGALIARHGGLGFYNGGRIAGASQSHKHLQWVPESAASLDDFLPETPAADAHGLFTNALLPWAHAFVRLDDGGGALATLPGAAAGARLEAAFHQACRALELPADADPMPPYNLLVSRRALLLVPRREEKWQDVSVNSLAYAGSLFVRDPEQIDRLRACGPLAVLAAVGRPTR